jgi:signal transduction histidine kinase
MSLFLNQIYNLLTTSPGNLLYHIVLVFSIAGALQGAIHLLLSSQFPQARRTVLGLAVLLGLQIILILVSGLTWQGPLGSQTVLPPLDRVVTLLGLVWIIWLWAFPEPSRRADVATVLLNLVALIGFGLTLAFWIPGSLASFNTSIFETIWQGISLVVALLGILVLSVRKPNGWGNGLAMLLLALIGHLVSLFFTAKGDYPGYVRLTQLALFPILLTLVQRFSSPVSKRLSTGKTVKSANEPIVERRRYSTDPKTFQALLSLAAEADADKIASALTRGIAQAMMADLCFLITLTADKNLVITCGYDLIREENLDGTAVNKDIIPLLANAILHGRPLRLPASSTSSDLKGLGEILGLSNSGNLLSVPISSREREPLGGILILSPYSNRLWSADDQSYLSNVSPLFVPILERGQRVSVVEVERDQARQVALSLQEQAANAKKKYEDAAKELDELHEKTSRVQLQGENMAVLVTMQEESQKTIDSLKAEIEQLHKAKEAVGVSDYSGQLESEPLQELNELEPMQNSLEDASTKNLELDQRSAASITNEQVEVITSISQELRQPMSSIVGYTDLLLGDSVGILGALQRKFIERIKASTERIGSLVDDLIQITTLETGRMQFKPELTDLNLIIDNAMAYTSTQIREKNITMRLDIPDTSPHIQTDRDAFQQILIHLLQNATAATQAEGTITLRVQMQHEAEQYFISIQVTDSGGGIAAEDLPRVFARRYRAEHSLIQGLGDTGVGLSIAKAIVEAQGGRIWVETEVGNGSTFSILLPVLYDTELES